VTRFQNFDFRYLTPVGSHKVFWHSVSKPPKVECALATFQLDQCFGYRRRFEPARVGNDALESTLRSDLGYVNNAFLSAFSE
jgi:hypothetical protein